LRKTVSAIMLTLLLISMLTLAFNIQPAKGWTGTVYIRADGSIDPPDAPISTVDNVTYTLTGNINSDTHGIVIERSNIVVDGAGYTVMGSGDADTGIYVFSLSNVTLRNAQIMSFWQGIFLIDSSQSEVCGNTLLDNVYGIYMRLLGSSSPGYYNVTGNSLRGNTYGIITDVTNGHNMIFDNIVEGSTYGIWCWWSQYNIMSQNDLMNNERGIFLYASSENVITYNNVAGNSYGIYLERHWVHPNLLSEDNRIYHNNFVGNVVQRYVEKWMPNFWNDSYPSGGNYWSDYDGVDGNGDGIGDTPYIIDALNVDNYPLMQPTGGFQWMWGDDDNDGILNYLDSGIFSFDESDAQSASAFGIVATPIKITRLLPSLNYGQMMAALHEWGVKETPIKRLMCVFVVDVSNVYGVLSWLRTHGLVSANFYNKALNSLCADGHWRSLWVIRSDLDGIEVLKAAWELMKSMVHPDLAFDAITRFINLFDVEFYTLTGIDSVTASLSFDFASISERLASARKYLKELFISASSIIGLTLTAIAKGGFAGIAFELSVKLINFILDYLIFDYVESDFLDLVKLWVMAVDPPGDRVVLQLFDASGQTLLIGHNHTLDEDICVFEHGIYSADNDSAILILSRTGLDYNFTVTTTPTTVTPMPYTMILWDCTQNDTIVTGGLLDPQQSCSTRLNLTNNELDTSYLSVAASLSNPNPQPGELVEVSMNVTDDEGTPFGDCDVVLSIANEAILAQNQGDGFYNATIDTVGLAGFYNVTIFTRDPPPGFLQGMVTLPLEVGPHDIAVMNTSLSSSILGLRYELAVNLTLHNEGFFAEAFNLTIYANATVIASLTNIALAGNDSMVLTQEIATSGWTYGNYSIWAYAEPVPGETDIDDNTFIDGWVLITSQGWKHDFIGPTNHPIVDFAVYNGSLYAAADNKLYLYDGNSWGIVDAPAYVTSLETCDDKLVAGAKGGLYCYNGTSFTHVFTVPTYIKALGTYNGKLYAGTMLDNPPTLYYCEGSGDNPADWHVDTGFSAILNFSGAFGSIDSFAVYGNEMYAGSGGKLYSFNGTSWSIAASYADVYAFLDMQVYNGKLYFAMRDQAWRKPVYQGGTGFSGRVIQYDGENWTTIFEHDYWIYSLGIYDDKLYAGTANAIFTYNGATWETSFNATEGAYYALCFENYDDKIYVGMGNGYIFADPAETASPQTPTVPEFPSFIILLLFMIATLLAVMVYRRKTVSDRTG